MAKTLERKPAKLLAFILALIMIGSVAVVAFRGSTYIPKREIKYEFKDVLDVISKLPDKPDVIYYLDFSKKYEIASSIAKAYAQNLFKNRVFNYVKLVGFNSTIVAFYYNTGSFLYLFDTDKRIFASYDEKKEIDGFDVKIKGFYGVVDEINPAVIGTTDKVYELIKNIKSDNESKIITRIPKRDYFFIRIFQGDVLNSIIKLNQTNESITDFYFEGYSMNGSKYEKVVAMNFTKNVFFVESNKTEEYYVKNYGGFSIAIMVDSNFTKLLTSTPEMRSIIIKGL